MYIFLHTLRHAKHCGESLATANDRNGFTDHTSEVDFGE